MRKMIRVTLSSSFLIGSICFLILIFAGNSLAQSKTRKTQAKKTQTIAKPSGTSAVISRFIKAMQDRDFKTVIDLIHSYQLQIDGIRKQHPRVLWDKKIGEFYDGKISLLTEESSFWGDYTRNFGAMTGDPAQNFRAVAYLLPQSCKWKISGNPK